VHSNVVRKRVGENNTQEFSRNWPADEKSIRLMVISMINTTILSIMNTAIASGPAQCWLFGVLWGCQKEANASGG
jgi:hypothetical protein